MTDVSHKTPPIRMTLREAQAAASETDWQRLNKYDGRGNHPYRRSGYE